MPTYKDFTSNSRRRRRRQGLIRALMLLAAVLIILGLAYLIVKIATILYPQTREPEDFSPVGSLSELLGEDPNSSASADGVTTEAGPTPVKVDEASLLNPDFRMLALPENGRVDMSYFDNAVFLGDSLTQGFKIYNNNTFPNSVYAAWKGVSPMTLLQNQMEMDDGTQVNALDYVVASDPGKVYVLLGSNALTWQEDDIILKYYGELMDQLAARLPGCPIYIQSIPTCTVEEEAKRTAKGQDLTRERINRINDQLAKLAYARGFYFLDIQETLCGDDGYLRTDYDGGDGLHLNADGYLAWREYLITHAAHRWDNPYLIGSPYYDPDCNDSWLRGDLPADGTASAESTAPADSTAEPSETPAA